MFTPHSEIDGRSFWLYHFRNPRGEFVTGLISVVEGPRHLCNPLCVCRCRQRTSTRASRPGEFVPPGPGRCDQRQIELVPGTSGSVHRGTTVPHCAAISYSLEPPFSNR